jgi:hypothetical protein
MSPRTWPVAKMVRLERLGRLSKIRAWINGQEHIFHQRKISACAAKSLPDAPPLRERRRAALRAWA